MKVGLRSTKPNPSSSARSSTTTSKPPYDPSRKWGLLPSTTTSSSSSSSQPTYIVGPTVITSYGKPEYTSEVLGRNGRDAVRKRKRDEKEAEEEFLRLLGRDGGRTVGGKAIEAARRAEREREREEEEEEGKGREGRKGKKGKEKRKKTVESGGEEEDDGMGKEAKKRLGFTAEQIKAIGFDPTLRHGVRKKEEKEGDAREKLEAISLLTALTSTSDPSAPSTSTSASTSTKNTSHSNELAALPRTLKSTDAVKHRTSVRKPDWAVKADREASTGETDRGEEREERTSDGVAGGERMVEFSDSD